VAKPRGNQRTTSTADPGGLWHQPALMNLLADVLIVLAIAGLAWAGLTALQRLPIFPLRSVVLTDMPRQVPVEQVEHVARRAVGGNFFTVDLDAAQTAFEQLPWVRKVVVSRQWPDSLSVTLEEHQAVARWRQMGGEQGLVNSQGEVFSAERPEGVPTLPQWSGPEGSAPEILKRYGEFGGVLARAGRRIDTVTLSSRRAWLLKLDDGVAVELGRDQSEYPLVERLDRFATYYAKLRQRVGTIRVADMRYPNGFVLSGLTEGVRPAARKEPAGRKS
jgi:cell division protein FtsQ